MVGAGLDECKEVRDVSSAVLVAICGATFNPTRATALKK